MITGPPPKFHGTWDILLEQQRHGVFPRVWWLTGSERRERRLLDVIASLTPEEQALFAVALASDAPQVLLSDDGDES